MNLLFPDTYETTAREHCVHTLATDMTFHFLEEGRQALHAEDIIAAVEAGQIEGLMIRTLQIQLDAGTLKQLGRTLRLISLQASGYDILDLPAATEAGIAVATVPITAYALDEVVEFTFSMLLAGAKRTFQNDTNVRQGEWRTKDATDLLSLNEKTLGIVGFGHLGSRIAPVARAFGMDVIVHTAHPTRDRARQTHVRFVDLSELLAGSDFIILAVPLTRQTRHLLNHKTISQLKQDVTIVNVCRGAVVSEDDVAEALHAGKIFAYCTDVFAKEPPDTNSPLLSAPNVVLSPHIAWKTRQTTQKAYDIWFENVRQFCRGEPQNVINPEVL